MEHITTEHHANVEYWQTVVKSWSRSLKWYYMIIHYVAHFKGSDRKLGSKKFYRTFLALNCWDETKILLFEQLGSIYINKHRDFHWGHNVLPVSKFKMNEYLNPQEWSLFGSVRFNSESKEPSFGAVCV